jgi:DNA gyrase/topoisomerase IV subunit A
MVITEVPYGYDREGYIKVLDTLEDNNDIVSYEDQCDKTGFRFEIKLKLASANAWTDERIIRKFKLSKPLTENLTVIDQNGKLREYKDERELIKDFVDYRLTVLQERINLRKKQETEESRWLKVKMQFIQAVLDGTIQFKNKKKDVVSAQILKVTDSLELDVDKLLRINMLSLTDEMVKDLKQQIESSKDRLKFWTSTTPKDQFENDLEGIK